MDKRTTIDDPDIQPVEQPSWAISDGKKLISSWVEVLILPSERTFWQFINFFTLETHKGWKKALFLIYAINLINYPVWFYLWRYVNPALFSLWFNPLYYISTLILIPIYFLITQRIFRRSESGATLSDLAFAYLAVLPAQWLINYLEILLVQGYTMAFLASIISLYPGILSLIAMKSVYKVSWGETLVRAFIIGIVVLVLTWGIRTMLFPY